MRKNLDFWLLMPLRDQKEKSSKRQWSRCSPSFPQLLHQLLDVLERAWAGSCSGRDSRCAQPKRRAFQVGKNKTEAVVVRSEDRGRELDVH